MTMTLKQYLEPNMAVRPPIPSPELWTLTTRSRGVAIVDDTAVESEAQAERKETLVNHLAPARPATGEALLKPAFTNSWRAF